MTLRLPASLSARAGRWLVLLADALAASARPAGPAPNLAAGTPQIFMVGDSTMADKPTDPPNPEHGWGQALPEFFRDPAMIVNRAQNGRSTKSFIDEGRWQAVTAALRPGDWVIIQFGHNDEKAEDPTRYAAPHGAYEQNLRRFVRETRDRGGHPVLCTPVMRRRWDDQGRLVDLHGDYPAVVRQVAREENVPLLDLHLVTRDLIEEHGVEGSKKLFLWIPPGTYARRPEGWRDDTHFSAYGARRVAALAVQEMLRLQLPLIAWLR